MKNSHIAQVDLLHAFNLITMKGNKANGHYEYQGIKAWHDVDGYTCFLGYNDLTLTLLFHGRYTFDFKEKETFDAFISKLNKLLVHKV